jgi:hypothetical protein
MTELHAHVPFGEQPTSSSLVWLSGSHFSGSQHLKLRPLEPLSEFRRNRLVCIAFEWLPARRNRGSACSPTIQQNGWSRKRSRSLSEPVDA